MVLSNYKPIIEEKLLYFLKKLVDRGVNPNHITLTGLIFGILSIISLYILKNYAIFLLFITLMSLMDMFDGIIARASGRTTKFGAFLDSTVDRMEDAIFAVSLMILKIASPLECFLFMVGMFLVSYTRARSESLGLSLSGVGIAERGERVICLIVLLLIYPINSLLSRIIFYVLFALTYVTVVQRIIHVWKNLK
ncbi:MAG: CDP-alcohol phosphatidyltransferase family protein [Thermoprotei archaeon]|nr:MAG: CDP-alcohol phosphatidyltransferase family protein [Thermoprotei archaeon]